MEEKIRPHLQLVETYRGIRIMYTNDPIRPYSTIENVPILDIMEVGHFSVESAKKYIDDSIRLKELNKRK